ncbi:DUF1707 and DUF4190 domain-containing protein [Kitasatospora mediocidica]|uniref:DUF1707 and DUF4190 domain-containing protein n=1 Tax=Kitasatospora mediocidica TaxID=58352 RepID=UPI000B226A85|nr:DUF1707 and DUF4190 domain-containing protein [Kitasatospora mediocidica]
MSGMQPWQGSPPPWDKGTGGWQPLATPQAAMRAAHTDRDRTVDVLKAAYAEGRLSAEEYSQRFDAAHRAQTYGQLSQLVADLPSGPMAVPFGASAPSVPMTFLPPRPRATNGLAVASLTLGLLSLPTMGLLGIPALVTGHVAKSQIRQRGEEGDLMATIGLVIGWVVTAGWVGLVLLGALLAATHS